MQSASSNFTQEASGGAVTWAKPRVFADWDRTGYGAAGSIDDLSDQVGDTFSVEHHLDDGLPSEISRVSGLGTPTLTTPLAYGRTPGQGAPEGNRRASQYFSPYNGSSPVSGFDRDVAPVKLDWGLVHAGGQEYIRLFTGQMVNIPTRGQGAELQAMSATRMKMRKLIQPYAIEGSSTGLNATWPVSYALAQCGIYVSPAPRSGCRWWAPMHGSLAPMIPAQKAASQAWQPSYVAQDVSDAAEHSGRPVFISGPFVLAANGALTTTAMRRSVIQLIEFDSGTDLISQAGNKGRIEFWIKGDTWDNSILGTLFTKIARLEIKNAGTNTGEIKGGVDSSRKVFVTVDDGAGHVITLQSPTTLATDGGWYFVGVAWDIAGQKLWVNHNGTVTTTAAPTLVTTSLPAADNYDRSFAAQSPFWVSSLPVAEIQVTSGANANPDLVPWLADRPFTPQATIRPSFLELEALIETVPREAWEFISSIAQAELAMMRTDENDVFNYLPMSYWAETTQQAVVDLYSTSRNAQDIDVDADPTKIFNVVSVQYTDTRTDRLRDVVYRATTQDPLPPGMTVRRLALQDPVTYIEPALLTAYSNADSPFANDTYFTLNTAPDGSGSFATQSQVSAKLTAFTAGMAEITFVNNSGATLYFVNGVNAPTLQIGGLTVVTATGSATARDATSIATRGERALTVSLPAIQRASDALAVASELTARLMKPRKAIGSIPLFPDPRRQPGDLVQLTDAVNTGASGLWRVQSITHDRSGDDYTQQALVNEALPVGHWDVDGWDNFVWGA